MNRNKITFIPIAIGIAIIILLGLTNNLKIMITIITAISVAISVMIISSIQNKKPIRNLPGKIENKTLIKKEPEIIAKEVVTIVKRTREIFRKEV